MEKTQKKRIKRYIAWGCMAALATALAVMPLLAAKKADDSSPVAVVKSGTAENSSITGILRGGGTLSEETAQAITVPAGVRLTGFLVENGDTVSKGEALAAVDKVSVMTAIAQVQETLDYLDKKLEAASSGSGTTSVRAQTAGRVKIVYAQPGDKVQDVILAHGALAVLSLDGRMALDIEATGLKVGDSVLVSLSSGEEITGRVESTLGDTVIITVADNGYEVDTPARVSTLDGEYLGYGKLYIYNAWNATAYYGTVSTVQAVENKTVYTGETLFTLKDTDQSAQFEILLKQRQEYEDVLAKLFTMYQAGVIPAPCDGIVSGVDQNSEYLLRADGESPVIQLLANAPTDNPDAVYTNTLVWIQSVNTDGSWNVKTAPGPSIEDYLNFSVSWDTSSMTDGGTMSAVSIFTKVTEGEQAYWAPGAAGNPGDILLAADSAFAIRVGYAEIPTEPPEGGEPGPIQPPETDPTQPEQTDPTQPSEGDEPTVPGEGAFPSGDDAGGAGMGGMTGGYSGGTTQQPVFELFDLAENTILTVTPGGCMTLDITVDELDIGKIALGQSADVSVTALNGSSVTGTVSKIGSAVNSGGNSKYTVTITLPREENMLSGMSACASLALPATENALTIPAAALNDDGTRTFVYTGRDEKTGAPNAPATVTTGVSDGENVQILTGLNPGDSFWYFYFDPNA